jgi:hypothetical protein
VDLLLEFVFALLTGRTLFDQQRFELGVVVREWFSG